MHGDNGYVKLAKKESWPNTNDTAHMTRENRHFGSMMNIANNCVILNFEIRNRKTNLGHDDIEHIVTL